MVAKLSSKIKKNKDMKRGRKTAKLGKTLKKKIKSTRKVKKNKSVNQRGGNPTPKTLTVYFINTYIDIKYDEYLDDPQKTIDSFKNSLSSYFTKSENNGPLAIQGLLGNIHFELSKDENNGLFPYLLENIKSICDDIIKDPKFSAASIKSCDFLDTLPIDKSAPSAKTMKTMKTTVKPIIPDKPKKNTARSKGIYEVVDGNENSDNEGAYATVTYNQGSGNEAASNEDPYAEVIYNGSSDNEGAYAVVRHNNKGPGTQVSYNSSNNNNNNAASKRAHDQHAVYATVNLANTTKQTLFYTVNNQRYETTFRPDSEGKNFITALCRSIRENNLSYFLEQIISDFKGKIVEQLNEQGYDDEFVTTYIANFDSNIRTCMTEPISSSGTVTNATNGLSSVKAPSIQSVMELTPEQSLYNMFAEQFRPLKFGNENKRKFDRLKPGFFSKSPVFLLNLFNTFIFNFNGVITNGCITSNSCPLDGGNLGQLMPEYLKGILMGRPEQISAFVDMFFGGDNGYFFMKFIRLLLEKGKNVFIISDDFDKPEIIELCLAILMKHLNNTQKHWKSSNLTDFFDISSQSSTPKKENLAKIKVKYKQEGYNPYTFIPELLYDSVSSLITGSHAQKFNQNVMHFSQTIFFDVNPLQFVPSGYSTDAKTSSMVYFLKLVSAIQLGMIKLKEQNGTLAINRSQLTSRETPNFGLKLDVLMSLQEYLDSYHKDIETKQAFYYTCQSEKKTVIDCQEMSRIITGVKDISTYQPRIKFFPYIPPRILFDKIPH